MQWILGVVLPLPGIIMMLVGIGQIKNANREIVRLNEDTTSENASKIVAKEAMSKKRLRGIGFVVTGVLLALPVIVSLIIIVVIT